MGNRLTVEIGEIHGRTWLYHPSGVKAEMPIPIDPRQAYDFINLCLGAGWLAEAPTGKLEKLTISHVIRGEVTNNGRNTPRVWFYTDFGKTEYGAAMTVYLNNDSAVAAFERASGLTLAKMPLLKGKSGPSKESGDFARNCVNVKFTIVRRKVNITEENPKGNWELVGYVNESGELDAVVAGSHAEAPADSPEGDIPTPPATPPAQPEQSGAIAGKAPHWWHEFMHTCVKHFHGNTGLNDAQGLAILNAQDFTGVHIFASSLDEAKKTAMANAAEHGDWLLADAGAVVKVNGKGKDRVIQLSVGVGVINQWSRQPFIESGWITDADWKEYGTLELRWPIPVKVKVSGKGEDGTVYYTASEVMPLSDAKLSNIPF